MIPANELTLSLDRVLQAPRERIWRCWTEPPLLCQWFCPRPWGVSEAQIELHAGGRFFVRMKGPQGEDVPSPGVFLEVVPGRRLVFTDAFVQAWLPSAKPFMVGEIELADAPEGHTRYAARAHHWNAQDKEAHEKMGFHAGWNAAADQLEALARSL